jgi:hypothetical protein
MIDSAEGDLNERCERTNDESVGPIVHGATREVFGSNTRTNVKSRNGGLISTGLRQSSRPHELSESIRPRYIDEPIENTKTYSGRAEPPLQLSGGRRGIARDSGQKLPLHESSYNLHSRFKDSSPAYSGKNG